MTKVAMKFRVRDEAHSKAIQEKLFRLGYKWSNGDTFVSDTDEPFLVTQLDGSLYYYREDCEDSFNEDAAEEYAMIGGLLVSASIADTKLAGHSDTITPEDISPKPVKVVSTGGSSSYYQLTITNKAGESIQCETGDVIAALVGDNFPLGNVLKALRRIYECSQGRGKSGVDMAYDIEKCKYFLDDFYTRHINKSKQ